MIELREVSEGQFVWAKLKGYDWWPGMVVPASLCTHFTNESDSHLCVYWYGHNSVSKVDQSLKMCDFLKGFPKCFTKNKTKMFKFGVFRAGRDLMLMHKHSENIDVCDKEVYDWILATDPRDVKTEGWKLSGFVQEQLKLLSMRFSSKTDVQTSTTGTENASNNVKPKLCFDLNCCLSCESSDAGAHLDHPIFEKKKICCVCLEKLKRAYFVHRVDDSSGSISCLSNEASLGLPLRNGWRENMLDMFHQKQHPNSHICVSENHVSIFSFSESQNAGAALCLHLEEMAGIRKFELFLCDQPSRGSDTKDVMDAHNFGQAVTECTITYLGRIEELELLYPLVKIEYYVASRSDKGNADLGSFFFHFFKTISTKKGCKWIFQMPAPYNKGYVRLISRFLECEPGLWRNTFSTENFTWTNERSLLRVLEEPEVL
ncbi:uncharacterized protein LOC117639634 [Thrips palmi]|uniref:Uncharacterized protein LOC117639634 n=1 Tax=Thrips palmi TaxID=161013 RepID=A0A6P8Y4M1_THRPL|nr:uncharacterized protein LOC117639634 [Thrips palmi]